MSRHPTNRHFSVKIPIRFRDLDPMGHVNNAVYFTYLETARTAYWLALHHARSYDVLDFVVARAECDYETPATLRDALRVECRMTKIGSRSFDLEYRLVDEHTDRLIATGKTIQVMTDARTGRSREIEPELRERMRSFSEHWGTTPEE